MNLKVEAFIYAIVAAFGLAIIWLVKSFWPENIPFDVMSFWNTTGSIKDWLTAAAPIFAWGVGVNIVHLFRQNSGSANNPIFARMVLPTATEVWIDGLKTSVFAGVFEEIYFRWIYFLTAMATVYFFNFLFFDWLGFGIPHWFFVNIWEPLADWTTLHYLHAHIFSEKGWAIGAAMLATNAGFRNGHKYQGFLGYVNSWFIGMFFFWIMFQYGLPVAILVHFTYDFLIFTCAALYVAAKRA